jgi:hypothetical protein
VVGLEIGLTRRLSRQPKASLLGSLPLTLTSTLGAKQMFSRFKSGKSRVQSPSQDTLLNEGLHLAMEWGEDWLKPIQERLTARHPALSNRELDEINAICQDAMRFGHGVVYDLTSKSGMKTKPEDFESEMIARYPWVNSKNLSRLFSQGMYYTMN